MYTALLEIIYKRAQITTCPFLAISERLIEDRPFCGKILQHRCYSLYENKGPGSRQTVEILLTIGRFFQEYLLLAHADFNSYRLY